jgi:hypothetical protein
MKGRKTQKTRKKKKIKRRNTDDENRRQRWRRKMEDTKKTELRDRQTCSSFTFVGKRHGKLAVGTAAGLGLDDEVVLGLG